MLRGNIVSQGNIMPKVSALLEEKGDFNVISVSPHTAIVEAAQVLAREKIGVLVCRDSEGGLVGIFSERDLVKAVADNNRDFASLSVRDLASPEVVTCKLADDLKDVIRTMGCGGFRHMPVVAGGQIVGLISVTDIFRHYTRHAPDDQAEILCAYADPFAKGSWA